MLLSEGSLWLLLFKNPDYLDGWLGWCYRRPYILPPPWRLFGHDLTFACLCQGYQCQCRCFPHGVRTFQELRDGAIQVKCKLGSWFSLPYTQGRYSPNFNLNTIKDILTVDAREAILILYMLLEGSLVARTVDLDQSSTSSGALLSVVSYSQSINFWHMTRRPISWLTALSKDKHRWST